MLKQVLEIAEILDRATVTGYDVAALLSEYGAEKIWLETVVGPGGSTDFVQVLVPGYRGKRAGGTAPSLGVIGRLGGIGARPTAVGMVSDADGCLVAMAVALKLLHMRRYGDCLPGDVIISTHICPNAPTQPHQPVPFMGSPVDMATMNRMEVHPDMDAVISIDTTRGNRVINVRGFAISPTIKEGYILKVNPAFLDIMSWVTGRLPAVFPVAHQDITPYGNGIDHLNSILQPATATAAPVLGVALTAQTAVPGCATGATQEVDDEEAARFVVEVAKSFTAGQLSFYDVEEFARLRALYGSLGHFQTTGRGSEEDVP